MIFEIKTIFLSMMPIVELKGSIPLAIGFWHLQPLKVFLLATLGNMIPVFFLLLFWKYSAKFLMKKSKIIRWLFNWLFRRTFGRFYKKYSVCGDIALILLVAIPLPFTGAWTGTVATFLFDIPYGKSLGLIFIGVVIGGMIVTLATVGFIFII